MNLFISYAIIGIKQYYQYYIDLKANKEKYRRFHRLKSIIDVNIVKLYADGILLWLEFVFEYLIYRKKIVKIALY